MKKYCDMQYGRDETGEEVLVKDGKFQVMMAWEKPYMHACIDALQPSGDVLEIGFGLGFSADKIQSYHPKSHTIIEYHPEVLKKAKEWAARHSHVTIVEGTWQDTLATLGEFDAIFFDDYPLESAEQMAAMKEQSVESRQLLEQGQHLIAEVKKELPFLQTIRYCNEDLDLFFSAISLHDPVEVKQVARFLSELLSRSQITADQLEYCFQKILNNNTITQAELDAMVTPAKKNKALASVVPTGDRFYDFLGACLRSHMRIGARFSCFLESSRSLLENEKFFNEVALNPLLEFHGETIDITVPAHCRYFEGQQPRVMTITKRG